MNAIHDYLPEFAPTAYLGDAAEAFANATQAIFPSVEIRLMCFAHVYKASHQIRFQVSSFKFQFSGFLHEKKIDLRRSYFGFDFF